jgi:hypothetical protein
MRVYFLLIFTAILLSFSTAYFALNLEEKNFASKEDIQEIEDIQEDFKKTALPLAEIDLSTMYPTRDAFQLIQPISSYSRGDVSAYEALFSKTCLRSGERMTKLYFDKDEFWEDFRCKRITKLPDGFFEYTPLVHETGVSYAFMAFLTGREPFNRTEWVKRHLNFFHALELKKLPAETLDGHFKYLSVLSKDDLDSIGTRKLNLITKDYYLRRIEKNNNLSFLVYSRSHFENFIKEKSYFIRPYKNTEKCFYSNSGVCWEKNSGSITEILKNSSMFIFISSIVVLLLIAVILYNKIKTQKFEEERKKHALRVLTHELRTPIANLLLQVESINKHSDQLPNSILEDFLKIEGEVYRLKRLAEKSSAYLQSQENDSLMNLNYKEVSSINKLVEEMVNSYGYGEVIFEPIVQDQSFCLDIYWFNICVRNLIENAFKYGKPPVKVKLGMLKNYLKLDIIDSGSLEYSTLEEILKSRRSTGHNEGLGMGLTIVKKIIQEMGGQLTYSNQPTVFSLSLRNNK